MLNIIFWRFAWFEIIKTIPSLTAVSPSGREYHCCFTYNEYTTGGGVLSFSFRRHDLFIVIRDSDCATSLRRKRFKVDTPVSRSNLISTELPKEGHPFPEDVLASKSKIFWENFSSPPFPPVSGKMSCELTKNLVGWVWKLGAALSKKVPGI